MGGASQVRVRLLGGLQVEGLEEREIGSRKGRTLLKLLVLARGAAVSADRIVDVLWGDDTPSRPADQVGVLVSRLRAVLGADHVTRTDAGFALRVDWLDLDDLDEIDERVAEAERRQAAGRPAAARAAAEAALALVRGPLVPDEEGAYTARPERFRQPPSAPRIPETNMDQPTRGDAHRPDRHLSNRCLTLADMFRWDNHGHTCCVRTQ